MLFFLRVAFPLVFCNVQQIFFYKKFDFIQKFYVIVQKFTAKGSGIV